ncbi:MAG: YbhN family protein [Anaerovoracaceae bacterium]
MKQKILRGGGLFILLAAATAWLILREYPLNEILAACSRARPAWLLAAVLMMGFFFSCEAANLGRGLELSGGRPGKRQLLFYALTGFFFSSITPSASGGQPMQLYCMHRDGIPASRGLLALMTELASFQTAAVLLAAGGAALYFCHGPAGLSSGAGPASSMSLTGNTGFSGCGSIVWLFLAGVILNLLILMALLLLLFSRRAVKFLLAAAFRLPRLSEAQRRKLLGSAAAWRRAAAALRKSPKTAVKLVSTSMVQLCGFCAVPWLIARSLSVEGLSLPLTAGTQAMLYVSVSSLPLPGAVGVTEGGFSVLFQGLFPPALLGCAMILSRLASFYVPLVVSGLGFLTMKNDAS